MKVVYKAENIIDANLVKGLLEAEGMMAFVDGQHLQGGIVELPAAGLVSVAVSESDEDAALKIVAEFEKEATAQNDDETRWDMNDGLGDWMG